jgi:DNA-binding transcriptional LysR family regulator
VLCASPDYLRRRGAPRTPQELTEHECVLLVGTQGRQDVWRFGDGAGGEIAVRVRGHMETNYGELVRDAVVAGLGIAVHSSWHVCNDLREGRLVQVLADYPIADSGIYAVMPQRRLVPPRVRAFGDFLAERFADPPWTNCLRK